MPSAWTEAIIIPVPKPSKDASLPGNYIPVSLTSYMCKLMEKIKVAAREGKRADPMSIWVYSIEIEYGCPSNDGTCYTGFLRAATSIVGIILCPRKGLRYSWKCNMLLKLYDIGLRVVYRHTKLPC